MPLSSPLVRVVIVEDEPIIRADIKALVEAHAGFIVVGECGTVEEGRILLSTTSPDLALLDVELGAGTSFDILEQLPALPFSIIFITGYKEYAIRAIKCGALDYLTKPLKDAEFTEALSKLPVHRQTDPLQVSVASSQLRAQNSRIALRSQSFLRVVELSDIVYCKTDDGYTTFYLADGKKVMTSKYLKEYLPLLPDEMFLQPHKSYVVGLRFIEGYQRELGGGNIILKDGTVIPVSFRRKDLVLERLTQR